MVRPFDCGCGEEGMVSSRAVSQRLTSCIGSAEVAGAGEGEGEWEGGMGYGNAEGKGVRNVKCALGTCRETRRRAGQRGWICLCSTVGVGVSRSGVRAWVSRAAGSGRGRLPSAKEVGMASEPGRVRESGWVGGWVGGRSGEGRGWDRLKMGGREMR